MVKGLHEYDRSHPVLSSSSFPRIVITGSLTGIWYLFTKQTRLLGCPKMVQLSIPVALLFSFFVSKGIAQQYVTYQENKAQISGQREKNLNHYMSEFRKRTDVQKVVQH